MRNRILAIAALTFLAFGCNTAETDRVGVPEQPIVLGDDVVRGEVLVLFDESVAEILENAGLTKSGPRFRADACDIPSVEEVLSIVGGYTIERVFPEFGRTESKARREGLHLWYRISFSEDAPLEDVIRNLSRLGEVSSVGCNRRIKKAYNGKSLAVSKTGVTQLESSHFDDELLPLQWHLVNRGDLGPDKFTAGADVNVEKAWEMCTGDPSIIVAVLDEGIDYTHPDLKDAMWVNKDEIWRSKKDNDGNGYIGDVYGYNFAENTPMISTSDVNDSGHGCHVAGVIGAVNNNGVGISSIAGGDGAGKGVRLMSCQIFSGNTSGTILDEARAIKYAADNGAVILQCSWGYTAGTANGFEWEPSYATDDEWLAANVLESKALDYFIHNAGSPDGVIEGGIAIFAGGNESAPSSGYPGAYPDFVSVAATAADWTPAVYTNYGPGTTISAPGGDQDYYYEYGEGKDMGNLGCVLSTLPHTVNPDGYGYMEGTSMACPHVSGVVALGLSYAAKLHKHFKAKDVIELLYSSATPVEQFWTIESKKYCKYVSDIGHNHLSSFNLNGYKGKMGHGQVNAYGFLKAIEGSGTAMTFPNVLVATGGEYTLDATTYFDSFSGLAISVKDNTIASVSVSGSTIVVKGLAQGQTAATVTAGGHKHDFVISVKDNASSNGWL